MKIAMLGTGNVAAVLGKLLLHAGHTIVQVWGRNIAPVKDCAVLLNAQPVTDIDNIDSNADFILIAVADKAIKEVNNALGIMNGIVLHTSGSVTKNVLYKHKQFGVLYPLQSLRKELPYLPKIPFFVDGNNEAVAENIMELAATLSGTVYRAGDEERMKLHLAAVISNNFINHLLALTQNFCEAENIAFNYLLPLIQETVQRTQLYKAADLQTGPAIRRDAITIEKHLQFLQSYPGLANLYEAITKSIQDNKTNFKK